MTLLTGAVATGAIFVIDAWGRDCRYDNVVMVISYRRLPGDLTCPDVGDDIAKMAKID